MFIREMTIDEFSKFAGNHFIGNYHQSISYALLKAEEGYEYEFICYDGEEIKAAALILYKKLGNMYYGYAPRGFLIDYSNPYLLEDFTKKIKEYYEKKGFAFIKINPEIAVAKLDKKTMNFECNENFGLIGSLINNGYKKLKSNMNFEALLPRINAIVNLDNFEYKTLNKNTRNKVRKGFRKGLTLELADQSKLDALYEFIKGKRNKSDFYYNDLYNVYSKTDNVDIFLVKVDYKKYLINSQNYYNYELMLNNKLNEELTHNNNSNIINKKMNSDKALLIYKNDIAEASKHLNSDIETYVAGAVVIKHQNRITIQISGFDKDMARFSPNYFLYYAILMHYKGEYKYADLNGITADLSKDNYYYGLNRFKLGFKPDVYEYIGEFDLVINQRAYDWLLHTGQLAKEFNK